MIKCEIEYDIRHQCTNVYVFDRTHWYIYDPNSVDQIRKIKRNPALLQEEDIEFLKIPFPDIENKLEEAFAKRYANHKGVDLSLYENTAKDSHIKDLKWVLTHFINKDKREN